MIRPTWLLLLLLSSASPGPLRGKELPPVSEQPYGAFAFQDGVEVPLEPLEAYRRFLEVDAWWDHTFFGDPARMYVEAWPGGGFYERIDGPRAGVLHATVIFLEEGKTLRMRGPLGLSGLALDLVFTLSFEETEGGTRVGLDARGSWELEEGWPETTQRVWHYLLAERYKPYCERTPSHGP